MDVVLSQGLRDRLLVCCGLRYTELYEQEEKPQILFCKNVWLMCLITGSFPK